jgi:predicted RNA binding protein YcfA (HicA-like mRNA interferase family)
MGKLGNIYGKEAVKAFQKAGWLARGQVESHLVLTKEGIRANLAVPLHPEFASGTLRARIRDSRMKPIIWVFLLVAVWAGVADAQEGARPEPVFVIHGPTIVAFFAPVTGQELKNESDLNEVLSDFQLYYGQASEPLRRAGIDFPDANTLSFRIRIGKKVRRYRMNETGVGYFFIAPGKAPHIEYGVMTDAGLLDAARKYFGIAIR